MPQGRFDGDSSYHANYIPGKAELQKQFRPEGQLKIGGSFEGNSSYGADYADKGMGQRAERSALPRNQVIPEGKFDGDSNYHENFLTNKYQKTDQYRPEGELKVGGNHFQGSSSYGADYENRGTGQRAERIPLPRNQVMP